MRKKLLVSAFSLDCPSLGDCSQWARVYVSLLGALVICQLDAAPSTRPCGVLAHCTH